MLPASDSKQISHYYSIMIGQVLYQGSEKNGRG